jgi:hypothetical protein
MGAEEGFDTDLVDECPSPAKGAPYLRKSASSAGPRFVASPRIGCPVISPDRAAHRLDIAFKLVSDKK